LEDPEIGENEALANSMGLFLQKTNIIRDYLEVCYGPRKASLRHACCPKFWVGCGDKNTHSLTLVVG
jgi:hypothetical protein